MRTLLFAILSSLFFCGAQAQNIELLSQDESYKHTEVPKEFEYIDYKMDLSSFNRVASFKLTIDKQGKNSLDATFGKFWEMTNKLGANAFSVEDVVFENNQYIVLTNVYYFNEATMQDNFSLYEDNTIIVFGNLNTKNEDKAKTFKLNKDKISLMPYTYIKYQNEVGQKAKVSVGGFMGSSVTIVGEENKLGRCFSLGGTSLMPMGAGVSVGNRGSGVGVGISISTGTVYPMDLSFGLFVMTILDTVKRQSEEVETIEATDTITD